MVCLQLRGTVLGEVDAVLFDKDGTLSISEPQLLTLAKARVFLCLEQAAGVLPAIVLPDLQQLLERAYGLHAAAICPAGITAVASRDHNLIATATASSKKLDVLISAAGAATLNGTRQRQAQP